MGPISAGLNILQGDKNASLGYVLPALYTIKNEINRIELYTEHRSVLRRKLIEYFDRRFFDFVEINVANKSSLLRRSVIQNLSYHGYQRSFYI